MSNKLLAGRYELIEKIGMLANEKGISFNQLVIQCCEFALDHLQSEEKKTEQ